MLTYKDLDKNKKAFIFELDNVLYPEKDYLLQVYYLFANLLEYTETVPPAVELIAFFKKAYEHHGPDGIFQRAIDVFGIDEKYLENFNRMHVNAKLPLKLILFNEVKVFLRDALNDGKRIFVLTKGNPLMQLNKLKQIEWGELGQHIKIYFYDELIIQGHNQPIDHLLLDNMLNIEDVLIFGADSRFFYGEMQREADYMPISLLLGGD